MKIVFLDIDGVLQPYDAGCRFMHPDKSIIKRLSDKYNTNYSKYNEYDVFAVYYDWDIQAVSRLRYILDSTDSKIIVSSDWRSKKFPNLMKDLLKIQGLDNYYYCDNAILPREQLYDTLYTVRSREINNSLQKYNIDNFVVLDDWKEMEEFFPNNSVITHNIISLDNMKRCIKILKK